MSINFRKYEKVQTIILSAGFSSRMGEDKALLDYDDIPIIVNLIRKIENLSEKVFIVLGENFLQVKSVIEQYDYDSKIEFIKNQNVKNGMFSSVKVAFDSITDELPIMLQLIDHPFVGNTVYEKLIEAFDPNYLIFKPYMHYRNKKRAGHPILFSPEFVDIIRKESIDSNLKELINRFQDKICYVEVEDQAILHNLNNKKDYIKALKIEKMFKLKDERM
ncbi:MAG: NTP transferase domain-containing protein [Candidatus Cloacimonetes bacterium]|nr:NTP transferase domain-containing protein [Candidatus Cloacimonadota bacterium]